MRKWRFLRGRNHADRIVRERVIANTVSITVPGTNLPPHSEQFTLMIGKLAHRRDL